MGKKEHSGLDIKTTAPPPLNAWYYVACLAVHCVADILNAQRFPPSKGSQNEM